MANLHAVVRSKDYIDTEIGKSYIEELIKARTSRIQLTQYSSVDERISADISYLLDQISVLSNQIGILSNRITRLENL